jgi:hypothetical protein
MPEGNLTAGIQEDFQRVAIIENAYRDLRGRGLDLFLVNTGYYMVALPEGEREPHKREGLLTMNDSDWKKYSDLVRMQHLIRAKNEGNRILSKPEDERIVEAMRSSQEYLAEKDKEGRPMKPLTSYERLNIFSAEKITAAMNNGMPQVNYDDVDLC